MILIWMRKNMININKEKCDVPNCPCYKFEFDICDEFDCNIDYCIKTQGCDCGGKYWEKAWIFHGEHLELNTDSCDSEVRE